MNFCSDCGARLSLSQSTVSYAPAFYEDEPEELSETAALIELDQVEGTVGRRMHDLGRESVTIGRGRPSDPARRRRNPSRLGIVSGSVETRFKEISNPRGGRRTYPPW